jgi:release factor glutamine methyltransferase
MLNSNPLESKQVYNQLVKILEPIYGTDEASAIAFRSLDLVFQLNKLDFLLNKPLELPSHWEQSLQKLANGMPFQYVFGKEYFKDLPFELNEATLIPRPETEELVDWVLMDLRQRSKPVRVLDIGTGSGCIPISIKHEFPDATLVGWDLSDKAISKAKSNAEKLHIDVTFQLQDVFKWQGTKDTWDVIVSNPPYVLEKEKVDMLPHVLNHEPALALFVSNAEPLVFYETITEMASQKLNQGGALFFEINKDFAEEVKLLLEKFHFSEVTIRHDFRGNARFVSGNL